MKKKIIVKIGSTTLTANTKKISYEKIENIAKQIVTLKDKCDIVLVSSGAIATAKEFVALDNSNKGDHVISKQALAAIGQPKLMGIYDEVFSKHGLKMAQCLVTYRDFINPNSKVNIKNTLEILLKNDYVPIINENDTTAVEEIILGDNDKLSAFVAQVIGAQLLIIVSDVDGLCDKNPHTNKEARLIEEITDLSLTQVGLCVEDMDSDISVGGMTAKIRAAKICKKNGIEMWIINGGQNDFLLNALEGRMKFTKFKF